MLENAKHFKHCPSGLRTNVAIGLLTFPSHLWSGEKNAHVYKYFVHDCTLGTIQHTISHIFYLAVPESIPGELQIASVTKDSITFGFKQVLKRDRATHYKIQLYDKIVNTTTVNTVIEDLVALHDRNTIFENLISGRTYYIRVRAVNLAGNGPWSEWMNATTLLGKMKSELLFLLKVGTQLRRGPLKYSCLKLHYSSNISMYCSI